LRATAERQDAGEIAGHSHGQGGWRLHGVVLALLALGGAAGLLLWAKWGFLVVFDTIRAYCF
jgi:hypothetical protein